jgi:hypothetical protein
MLWSPSYPYLSKDMALTRPRKLLRKPKRQDKAEEKPDFAELHDKAEKGANNIIPSH